MKSVRMHGGRLRLVAPSPRVARMLTVTGLDTIFDRCETEARLLARALPRSPVRSGNPDMTAYA